MTRIQTSNELRLAFNFTNSDLQDNRQGFMSYRQKRWLRLKSFLKFDWVWGVSVVVVFVLPALTIIGIILIDAISMFDSVRLGQGFLTVATISVAFIMFFWLFVYDWLVGYWSKYNGDIRAGKVSSVQIEINWQSKRGFSVLGSEACIKLSPAQLAHLPKQLHLSPVLCAEYL